MSEGPAIDAALAAAGLRARVRGTRSLSGGCIHLVVGIGLDDGREVVAKLNEPRRIALFEEEAAGLEALAETGAVLVPTTLAVGVFAGQAVLLMTAVEPGRATSEAWAAFGRDLAALHAAPAERRYGFASDNHLGATPQPNAWSIDWVEFNAEHRLGHQVRLAADHGRLEPAERRTLDALIARLDEHLPREPEASLLHGDLWSGNALPSRDRIAVIDPACSYGDGLADIAMMQLFGGFPPECYAAYFTTRAEQGADIGNAEARIAVYQLYHVLNHLNLFGRGYAAQAMSLARSLAGRE